MLKYLIVFSFGLVSSAIFTLLFSRLALKSKILKIGNIPLVGGLGISFTFILSLFLSFFVFEIFSFKVLMIAGICLVMLCFGLFDDLKELTVFEKLIAQSICAVMLIYSGVRTDIMYFGFWGNAVITFFAILGMTNAFNLLDILDGLAAGTSLIVSIAFFLMGLMNKNPNLQILALILSASSAGFLIFNLPPARAYLGNSGSHFLGMLIACIALITNYASKENVFALFSPAMILGLPIVDTILLIIFRLIKKKPPFIKSKDHLALRIGSLGFSAGRTILIMYLLCAVFAACGIALTRVNNTLGSIIVTCIFLLSIGMLLKLEKIEVDG